jgi:hypothetical protein
MCQDQYLCEVCTTVAIGQSYAISFRFSQRRCSVKIMAPFISTNTFHAKRVRIAVWPPVDAITPRDALHCACRPARRNLKRNLRVHASIYGCSITMVDKRNKAHLELLLDGTTIVD